MTDEEWFKLFDETSKTFKWFIIQYFGVYRWDELMFHINRDQKDKAIIIMNEIWFDLPDSRFNIIENPKGWREFLNLIEE